MGTGLAYGEEELFQGILGYHMISGRVAPWLVYEVAPVLGGSFQEGFFSYIPFGLVDYSYSSLKLVPLGEGVVIQIIWMLLVRLMWGRRAALLCGLLLAALPDYLIRRCLIAYGNHHLIVLPLGVMFLSFYAMMLDRFQGSRIQILFAAIFGLSVAHSVWTYLSVIPFYPLFALLIWSIGIWKIRPAAWVAMLVSARIGLIPWFMTHPGHNFFEYFLHFLDRGLPWGGAESQAESWGLGNVLNVMQFSSSQTANVLFLSVLAVSCVGILIVNRAGIASALKSLSPLPRHKEMDSGDWYEIVMPLCVIYFSGLFFIYTRSHAGNVELMRYWTPLYAIMVVCQVQGIVLIARSRRRILAMSGWIVGGLYFLTMLNAVPEVRFDQPTEEDLLRPGYSYFYFTGNLIAHHELLPQQNLFTDINVARPFEGQQEIMEGISIGIGALTGYDVSGHFEIFRSYNAEKRRSVFRGIGYADGLVHLKWRETLSEFPAFQAEELEYVDWGRRRFIRDLGRASLILCRRQSSGQDVTCRIVQDH